MSHHSNDLRCDAETVFQVWTNFHLVTGTSGSEVADPHVSYERREDQELFKLAALEPGFVPSSLEKKLIVLLANYNGAQAPPVSRPPPYLNLS